jgi:hypothetical protein
MKTVFLIALASAIFSNQNAYAQKVVDCSKMSASELRSVDDVETTCKKKITPAEKKKEEKEMHLLAKKEAKEIIASTFKDPDSVKFKNLRISNDGYWICGEVNAKNSYGGYGGFRRFYALWAGAFVRTDDGDSFNESYLEKECGQGNSKPFK